MGGSHPAAVCCVCLWVGDGRGLSRWCASLAMGQLLSGAPLSLQQEAVSLLCRAVALAAAAAARPGRPPHARHSPGARHRAENLNYGALLLRAHGSLSSGALARTTAAPAAPPPLVVRFFTASCTTVQHCTRPASWMKDLEGSSR